MQVGGKSASRQPIQSQSDSLETLIFSLNICVSFRACGIQTTEDAENLEIAKSMRAGDQKQKFNLEWPNEELGPGVSESSIAAASMLTSSISESEDSIFKKTRATYTVSVQYL